MPCNDSRCGGLHFRYACVRRPSQSGEEAIGKAYTAWRKSNERGTHPSTASPLQHDLLRCIRAYFLRNYPSNCKDSTSYKRVPISRNVHISLENHVCRRCLLHLHRPWVAWVLDLLRTARCSRRDAAPRRCLPRLGCPAAKSSPM